MDLNKMIAELQAERTAIEEAMAVLERLAVTQRKRRGRPPAWLTIARSAAGGMGGETAAKRVVSPEARKKMAAAQKRRWAAVRKQKAAAQG